MSREHSLAQCMAARWASITAASAAGVALWAWSAPPARFAAHAEAAGPAPAPPAEVVRARASGVSVAQYSANAPLEDRYFIRANGSSFYAGVLDGHGGWQTAQHVSEALPEKVAQLLEFGSASKSNLLRAAYTSVDDEYKEKLRSAYALGFGNVASCGCCAISALIEHGRAVVANAGDCRAILVRRADALAPGPADATAAAAAALSPAQRADLLRIPDFLRFTTREHHAMPAQGARAGPPAAAPAPSATYTFAPLSRDHSANSAEEQQALAAQHPNEPDIVRCRHPKACYVKGRLMPTRAFGDFYLKDPAFNNADPLRPERGRSVPAPFSPPYITASPDVRARWRGAARRTA